jgi:site-specific DNA recombinase
MKQGYALDAVFSDEGLSGGLSFDKRPGILDALASLEKEDVLLVAKRDRLSRGDTLAMAMIEAGVARKGAKIISTAGEGTESEDPASILMRRMVDAFGEYERLIIKSRTKAALQTKKAKGERVGHIPFGHKLAADGLHLEICSVEKDILQQIGDLKKRGLSVRAIAAAMNDKKVFNRGAIWNASSVHRIVQKAA